MQLTRENFRDVHEQFLRLRDESKISLILEQFRVRPNQFILEYISLRSANFRQLQFVFVIWSKKTIKWSLLYELIFVIEIDSEQKIFFPEKLYFMFLFLFDFVIIFLLHYFMWWCRNHRNINPNIQKILIQYCIFVILRIISKWFGSIPYYRKNDGVLTGTFSSSQSW